MELKKNEALDFIFAAKRFADRNKDNDPDYPGLPEIAAWCTEVEDSLSPFLLNDISLLVEKTILVSVYLVMITTADRKITSAPDFLKAIEKISPADFQRYFAEKLSDDEQSELTKEVIYKTLIDDGLHPGYDPVEEAELVYGFFRTPEDFLKRLHRTYSDFYTQAYVPGKKKLLKLSEEKYNWHRSRLQKDGEEYLKELGLQSFVKENMSDCEPDLYFTFFGDNETSAFWKIRTIVIGGGTDQRILHHSARDKADIFFSCLGDPKRLEIMRLTAQRPWYSTELAAHFDVKPATLSYHMNKLVDAELLHISKGEARRFYYTLNKEMMEEYIDYISQDLLGLDYVKKETQ